MNDDAARSAIDPSVCAREPIHMPGSIQPHGFLLAVREEGFELAVASANAENILGRDVAACLGQPLATLCPPVAALRPRLFEVLDGGSIYVQRLTLGRDAKAYDIAVHRADGLRVIEGEWTGSDDPGDASLDSLTPHLRAFLDSVHSTAAADDLCQLIADHVRQITGFDRVLVYRFDESWSGTVVAETRNDVLPSYLDLRFPASDVPAQARELYLRNRLRIIPDADYRPVPLVPEQVPGIGRSLDLSHSILRSVSPVHIEYMHNMDTRASMSVSIIVDGTLWGLVSCHNKAARQVPLQVRTACDFLTRIFSLQLAASMRMSQARHRMRLGSIQGRLLGYMAEEERFIDGLVRHPDELLALADAAGGALVTAQDCWVLGDGPTQEEVRELYEWLSGRRRNTDLFVTDRLANEFPAAESFRDKASGLLAISISKKYASYVMWFRPEVVQTVKWAGAPQKIEVTDPGTGLPRLGPRRSFDVWRETVRSLSKPWLPAEIDAAKELRNGVLGVVLRRAEDLAALTEELQRSNKELEAFSYSVSHDLRAPFRHIVGYSELLKAHEGDKLSERGRRYIDTIIEAAFSAGTLVDNLLSFSQMGRNALTRVAGDLGPLVEDVRRRAMRDVPADRSILWRIGPLGRVFADPVMLRLVFENLLSNALKYSRGRDPAEIEVGRLPDEGGLATFFVRDNGVGFDMAYVGKLFGVFQRLHRAEEFEGTGIGLANVRRIVERHGGTTWAEGTLGEGATFYFTLPLLEEAH